MTNTRIASLTSLAAVTAILFIAGCTSNAQPPVEVVQTPVRVALVRMASDGLPISASGTLESAQTARLSFKVGGPVARMTAEEGDRVRAGQLLAVLATDEIDAAVSQASAALEKARRDADRMDRLYRDSVVTLAQYQDAQTALSVAESSYKSASFNRQFAEITAPASGRVLRRHVEPGELVQPGAAVFEIGFDGSWVVRASVSDRDVVRLGTGNRAELQFDAFPGRAFAGRVARIGEAANDKTGAYDVEITLTEPDTRLRSGFIARAAITPDDGEAIAMIPAEALVRAEGTRGVVFVYDAETGSAAERAVNIAGLAGDAIAIASGLEEGESVVTDGAPYLTHGEAVTIARGRARLAEPNRGD